MAHVFPALSGWMIGTKNLERSDLQLIDELSAVHLNIRSHFSKTHNKMLSQVQLYSTHITCRPDFVLDNILLEVKCTGEYLAKEHVRRVVFYFLITLLQGKRRQHKIDHIQKYYVYRYRLPSWPVEKLLQTNKVEYRMKKLQAAIEKT